MPAWRSFARQALTSCRPMPFGHRQMMQITAPAIVTAKHGTNDAAIHYRNQTETRIASQVHGDGWARVGFVQPHTFRAPPQGDNGVVVFDAKIPNVGSIVGRAMRRFLFGSSATFLAGFHGLG